MVTSRSFGQFLHIFFSDVEGDRNTLSLHCKLPPPNIHAMQKLTKIIEFLNEFQNVVAECSQESMRASAKVTKRVCGWHRCFKIYIRIDYVRSWSKYFRWGRKKLNWNCWLCCVWRYRRSRDWVITFCTYALYIYASISEQVLISKGKKHTKSSK